MADPPSSISSTLLARVQARRPEAWSRLVDLFGPVVYRWCRSSGVGPEDAADVVQEVFSAVAAHVTDFRRRNGTDSFTAWLAMIARNKIRDHFRRRQNRPQARGGTDAREQLEQLPEPIEPTRLGRSREFAAASRPGVGPLGVRGPHVGRLLANHGRRPVPGRRRRGPRHDRRRRLSGQIPRAAPPAAGIGRINPVGWVEAAGSPVRSAN